MYINRDHDNFVKFIKNYWRYYRELEKEFIATLKCVELDTDNFNTYSIQYLKLFQTVCSEIDIIGKAMAGEINKDFKLEISKNNIVKWWYEIQNEFQITEIDSDIEGERIQLNKYQCTLIDDISVNAWDNFEIEIRKDRTKRDQFVLKSGANTPKWWNEYNRLRDNRAVSVSSSDAKMSYNKANLGNVCNAFAALYVLEKAYMQAVGTQQDLQDFDDFSDIFKYSKKNKVVEKIDDTDKILNELFSNGLI